MALIVALIAIAGCDPSAAGGTPIMDLRNECGDLRIGDNGGCVQELQRLLNLRGARLPRAEGQHGYGNFGENTLSAVQQFQHARGLPDEGFVSNRTKEALYDFPLQGVQDWDLRTECVDLEKGAEGQCVASLQRLLNQYYGAQLPDDDPTYGPRTTEAVLKFQRDHNLNPVGAVRSQTKQALYHELSPGTLLNPVTAAHNCPGAECSVYLSRATTAGIASAFDSPLFEAVARAVISQITCSRLKKLGVRVVCDVITQQGINMIGIFRQARDNHECVRISFESTSEGFKPVEVSQTGGKYCQD